MLKAIDGNGTYLVGWVMIAAGVAEAMGWVPAGTIQQAAATLDDPETMRAAQQLGDPAVLIGLGAGIIRLRMGAKKAETKAAEAVEAVKQNGGTS